MSPLPRSRAGAPRRAQAPIFAALGDKTRLALVATLCNGPARSISELAGDSALTRQAITKHLRVLERAGIVHSRRRGRESRFQFDRGQSITSGNTSTWFPKIGIRRCRG